MNEAMNEKFINSFMLGTHLILDCVSVWNLIQEHSAQVRLVHPGLHKSIYIAFGVCTEILA